MAKEKAEKKSSYGADSIQVLEGLEPVRKRPGMYIGTTGPDGFHHLITEIFDNSRDEAMGGFANDIEIVFIAGKPSSRDGQWSRHSDGYSQTDESFRSRDDYDNASRRRKIRWRRLELQSFRRSPRCRRVCRQRSSIYCKVEVERDGGKFMQEYSKGKRKAAVKKVGTSKLHGTSSRLSRIRKSSESNRLIFPPLLPICVSRRIW